MSDLVGQYLGRYHVLEPVGEGGMAVVYKAYDTRLERYVAIKIIRAGLEKDDLFLKRFTREAKVLGALRHPNIVKVLDTGEHNGLPFLVMEYVPGETLKTKMGTAMDWSKAAGLILPIARALHYAHEQKVLHRDLKPGNIILNAESGAPMLTDFGIAKILESDDKMNLTVSGVGIGTPEYMAPEQGIGTNVDCRADIYGLGVVFYELVVGQRPYQADTPLAVIVKMINDPLPSPREFLPELPEFVEQVMLKALAKNPADRYPTMGVFADVLEKLALGKDSRKPILEEVVTMATQHSIPSSVPPEKPGETLPDAATRVSSAPIKPPAPAILEEPSLGATMVSPLSQIEPPAKVVQPGPPLEATVAYLKGSVALPAAAEATVNYPKGGDPIPPSPAEIAPTVEMFMPQERKEVYLASPPSTPAKRKGMSVWLIAGIVLIVLCCLVTVLAAGGAGLWYFTQ
jgi:serine/threonine protein kinase